ncbi:hypothetical protein C8R47DRAFT_1215388 [Mycena vitilis]|nr:hypothetical protein C8R47DRAFT_1215388 [Mycena vitilis]
MNALVSIIPDLEPDLDKLPRGAVDIGDGYRLLRAHDTCQRDVRPCEENAIRDYIEEEFGEDAAEAWRPSVVRWARARLPNGHIARCSWKEDDMEQLRTARHVKIRTDSGMELAEVLFYFILSVGDEERHVALASFFGPPNAHLLEISSNDYWSAQHRRDNDLRVVNIKQLSACVTMAPDHQYAIYRSDGSEIDRWFLMQKPGCKLAYYTRPEESMEVEE